MLEAKLLDALDSVEFETVACRVWRVSWRSRDPIAGSPGGGRWSPPNRMEVLYTSFDHNGGIAEVHQLLQKAPVLSSSDKVLACIEVELNRVLRLDREILMRAGVSDPLARRADYSETQSVGEAAYLLDAEAMIVPSARWSCENLVIFPEQIDVGRQLSCISMSDLNWPAWIEAHKEVL